MRFWSWAGGHRGLVKLGSLAATLALLAGGLALGMNEAAGSPAPLSESPPVAAAAHPGRHYIVGTVAQVFPVARRALVRERNGRIVAVTFDAATVVRRDRQRQPPGALRRGVRVIVLGEPRDGHLYAVVVTITGVAPARPLPPSPSAPSATPAPRSGTPAPMLTPRRP